MVVRPPAGPAVITLLSTVFWELRAQVELQLGTITDAQRLIDGTRVGTGATEDTLRHLIGDLRSVLVANQQIREGATKASADAISELSGPAS